jgi:hypothetical protein
MKRLFGVLLLTIALVAGQADAKSYGSGGGKASGGARPAPAARAARAAPAPAAKAPAARNNVGSKPAPTASSSSGKKYGSGGVTSPPPQAAPSAQTNVGSKPKESSGFAGSQQQKEQSSAATYAASQQKREREKAAAYAKANPPPAPAPKPTYTDAKGQSRPIPKKDPEVDYLRGRLDGERYASRPTRVRSYYGSRYDYYYSRPVVVYGDHFSSAFHWWLLDQSLQTQAMWMYNHRYDMDQARYNALLSQNAMLAQQVNQLELQRLNRDAHWTPNGWEYDGMLDDNYVAGVYNPAPVADTYSYPSSPSAPISFAWMGTCFFWVVLVGIIGAVVWFIFIRERN